jgi:photosystem II stability/assembly factor-like uncharacterized protein
MRTARNSVACLTLSGTLRALLRTGCVSCCVTLLLTAPASSAWGQPTPLTLPPPAKITIAPPEHGTVKDMKQMAPDTGWAEVGVHRLFWTTDGGNSWKEITPPITRREMIISIFFLDANDGWVLCEKSDEPEAPRFRLAQTTNAGTTWSIAPITVPNRGGYQNGPEELTGGGVIAFADSMHGWMNLDVLSSAVVQRGTLFVTSDGGRTWDLAISSPGSNGPILLVSPTEGWLLGLHGEYLWVTRDGARTWRRVSIKAPKEIYPAVYPTYDLPTFKDKKNGFEPVTFSGKEPAESAAVLFKTSDGGISWTPDRILTRLGDSTLGYTIASTVADGTWITAASPEAEQPVLTKLDRNARAEYAGKEKPWGFFNGKFSFRDAQNGWIATYEGVMKATADGGRTWKDITPHPPPPPPVYVGPDRTR